MASCYGRKSHATYRIVDWLFVDQLAHCGAAVVGMLSRYGSGKEIIIE